jgi:hypothetical protein
MNCYMTCSELHSVSGECLDVDGGTKARGSPLGWAASKSFRSDLVHCDTVSWLANAGCYVEGLLTNQVLRTLGELLAGGQVIEKQLDVGVETSYVVVAGSHEAVYFHGAVVSEVQVEVVPCNGNRSYRRATL